MQPGGLVRARAQGKQLRRAVPRAGSKSMRTCPRQAVVRPDAVDTVKRWRRTARGWGQNARGRRVVRAMFLVRRSIARSRVTFRCLWPWFVYEGCHIWSASVSNHFGSVTVLPRSCSAGAGPSPPDRSSFVSADDSVLLARCPEVELWSTRVRPFYYPTRKSASLPVAEATSVAIGGW